MFDVKKINLQYQVYPMHAIYFENVKFSEYLQRDKIIGNNFF